MPFDPASIRAPFRMQPGLRRMAPGTPHLTPNQGDSPQLAAKLAVLTHHADQALCALPGFDDTAVIAALCRQARRDAPEALRERDDGGFDAPLLGWSLFGATNEVVGAGLPAIGTCLAALPARWRPTALLCLAFAEDFAVIDAASTRIPWLAVCLPSHWAPLDKLGRPFADVHAPVADNRLLLQAAEALARLVCSPDPWERFVWTLTPLASHDGHPGRQPAPPWPPALDAEGIADIAWLRTEHQTFIGMPGQAQAVFTILVELQPLRTAAPTCGRAIHTALASMSPAVLDYRGLGPAHGRLLDWLARHGGGPA
jgi:hypothetical protein